MIEVRSETSYAGHTNYTELRVPLPFVGRVIAVRVPVTVTVRRTR